MYPALGCPAATHGKHDTSALSLEPEQACSLYACKLTLNMLHNLQSPTAAVYGKAPPQTPLSGTAQQQTAHSTQGISHTF